ncbi:gamma-glutamylcyclotransferase [Bradyrhizobium sp. LA7.1]|uniref:gamma-glutamylcyclotransferase n=1 Tax=Bradyrhizobium sp. LA7.1 TaxID=3156324 RepID=UPI00339607DE
MVWVFGYGSLTFDGWQSKFDCVGHQRATLLGYRRTFNKKSVRNWGTRESPGITLNLERFEGARCEGVGFEFPDKGQKVLLDALLDREACGPTELQVQLADGRSVKALVYIYYERRNLLDPATNAAEKAEMIHKARGTSGSAVDYVRRNFEGLQAVGLEDQAVTELWEAVSDGDSGRA